MELSHFGKLAHDERGQSVIEYILLLSIILGFYVGVTQGLARIGIEQKLTAPITGDFARAYRYGKVDAKGFDDGGPENHPRIDPKFGNGNFRLFINPTVH